LAGSRIELPTATDDAIVALQGASLITPNLPFVQFALQIDGRD